VPRLLELVAPFPDASGACLLQNDLVEMVVEMEDLEEELAEGGDHPS